MRSEGVEGGGREEGVQREGAERGRKPFSFSSSLICRFNDALADFESAMKLNHSLPSPHVLAGLIHMNERKDIPKAVQCFTTAITVDQTCIRAYLCRAEAYKIDKQVLR